MILSVPVAGLLRAALGSDSIQDRLAPAPPPSPLSQLFHGAHSGPGGQGRGHSEASGD